ncbi:MAG: DUF5615 family PIN-like protein [Bryobacteraceae bacterium]
MDDELVLSHSRQAHAIPLTADKDFGELVFRQRLVHFGVLFIRLAGLKPDLKAALVASAIDEHGAELDAGFGVLSRRVLRIRKQIQ